MRILNKLSGRSVIAVAAIVTGLVLAGIIVRPALAADPVNGQKLYSTHCRSCHGNSGSPSMAGAPDFSRGESLLKSDSALLAVIRSGSGMMPAYRGLLTDEEILDIIAHLRTLRRR